MLTAPTSQPQDVYTDLNGLQSINKLGRENKDAALREVAEQFESMFVKMMMKSMREANKVFSEDSLMSSKEGDFYQQMYDDQLAVDLSSGNSLGLADVIYRQLNQEYGDPNKREKVEWQSIDDRRQSFSRLMDKTSSNNQAASANNVTASNTIGINDVVENSATKKAAYETPEEFVQALYPAAEKIGKEIGVNPLAIISQAALETGWGKHMITSKDAQGDEKASHNFFGIKADSRWSGDKVTVTTHEYRQGLRVNEQANFRSYDSIEDGLRDYGEFLQADRYKNALSAGQNVSDYAHELQSAGYATDPAYGQKITRISQSDTMQKALVPNQKAPSAVVDTAGQEVPRG